MQPPKGKSVARERLGGLVLIAIGALVIWLGTGYRLGTLHSMGAGFLPVVYGAIMTAVGVVLIATSGGWSGRHAGTSSLPKVRAAAEWRGWLCIVGGIFAFVVLGEYGGLVPASFASVFIAAMGDRENTVGKSLQLSALMTVAGILIFHWGLKVQLPLFAWG